MKRRGVTRKTYYLRDEEDGSIRRVTLKWLENVRNHTDSPVQYRLRCLADVLGSDTPRNLREIDYTLFYKEGGVLHEL